MREFLLVASLLVAVGFGVSGVPTAEANPECRFLLMSSFVCNSSCTTGCDAETLVREGAIPFLMDCLP